jgi:hypothetical protein
MACRLHAAALLKKEAGPGTSEMLGPGLRQPPLCSPRWSLVPLVSRFKRASEAGRVGDGEALDLTSPRCRVRLGADAGKFAVLLAASLDSTICGERECRGGFGDTSVALISAGGARCGGRDTWAGVGDRFTAAALANRAAAELTRLVAPAVCPPAVLPNRRCREGTLCGRMGFNQVLLASLRLGATTAHHPCTYRRLLSAGIGPGNLRNHRTERFFTSTWALLCVEAFVLFQCCRCFVW